jgi:hypothetical protein
MATDLMDDMSLRTHRVGRVNPRPLNTEDRVNPSRSRYHRTLSFELKALFLLSRLRTTKIIVAGLEGRSVL